MKIKTQNIISLFAIILFILGQVFLMSELWKINSDKLELSYGVLGRETVNDLYYSNQVLDSVYNGFSKIAVEQIITLNMVSIESVDSIKEITFEKFKNNLLALENISSAIKLKLEENNVNVNFERIFFLKSIELLPRSEKPIDICSKEGATALKKNKGTIKISSFIKETPLYRTEIELYIDIADKEKLVLKNTYLLIIIAMVCVTIVFIVYFSSLRNLRKERKLSDMKTDFLNNLMHELRTPLATIAVAGKTLEIEAVQNDKLQIISAANTIKRQNKHLSKLIDHIVDISIWEKEQFKLDLVKCDLKSMVQEIISACRGGTKSNVVITEAYDEKMPLAMIDVFHFTTMINNLLSNATKYSLDNPVINVEVTYNEIFTVSVSDNGIGISQEDQKYLFDKFYRVKPGKKHLVKGLGLGLYYVKKIAEAHGGFVKVKSKQNQGSTFSITLKKH